MGCTAAEDPGRVAERNELLCYTCGILRQGSSCTVWPRFPLAAELVSVPAERYAWKF